MVVAITIKAPMFRFLHVGCCIILAQYIVLLSSQHCPLAQGIVLLSSQHCLLALLMEIFIHTCNAVLETSARSYLWKPMTPGDRANHLPFVWKLEVAHVATSHMFRRPWCWKISIYKQLEIYRKMPPTCHFALRHFIKTNCQSTLLAYAAACEWLCCILPKRC